MDTVKKKGHQVNYERKQKRQKERDADKAEKQSIKNQEIDFEEYGWYDRVANYIVPKIVSVLHWVR